MHKSKTDVCTQEGSIETCRIFEKFRRFSSIQLSTSFTLSTFMFQILFVTPHFYTYVKFVCIYRFVAYLFDADSTDPDAWRNISFEESKIFSQFHPFANPSL